jgi:hypothetical protein
MELENDVAVSGEPEGFVDAEQEDAADLPVVEDTDEEAKVFGDSDEQGADGSGDEADGMDFGEEGEDAQDTNGRPGNDAGDVGRQPDTKKLQSKAEDAKYAAARRDAEQAQREAEGKARQLEERASADRARMDVFAREHGYADWAAIEKAERVRMYIRGGANPELANQMADQTELLERMAAQSNRAEGPGDEKKWDALVSTFPETRRMESLPQEVVDAVAGGMAPVDAYRDFKMLQLQAENEALKQNRRNRSKAVGNVKGKGTLPANRDAFVNGLYS